LFFHISHPITSRHLLLTLMTETQSAFASRAIF
jgi:hypothetical protein